MSDTIEIDPHGKRISFGKHAGQLFTRLPVSYLKWMVQEGARENDIAQAELDRRGTVTPDLDVSGHAIDRASQSCLSVWKDTRNGEEGLHAWLARMASEALETGLRLPSGKYVHKGLRLAIETEGAWPVVKTVMPGKVNDQARATCAMK